MTYDWEKATKTQEIIKRLKNGEKQTSIARDLGITQAYVATVKKNARLAEFEDKIESGLLVELPCKVGDKIYVIYQDYAKKNDYAIFCEKVDGITISGNGILIHSNAGELYCRTHDAKSLEDTIFTTKEAAEAKLKELRGE